MKANTSKHGYSRAYKQQFIKNKNCWKGNICIKSDANQSAGKTIIRCVFAQTLDKMLMNYI